MAAVGSVDSVRQFNNLYDNFQSRHGNDEEKGEGSSVMAPSPKQQPFNNTIGGVYEYNEEACTSVYTFPRGAFIQINSVRLDISHLRVKNYAGLYDGESLEHFVKVASRIQPHAQNVFNSDLFVNDNAVSGSGYPNRRDFVHYKIPFCSLEDFMQLQNSLRKDSFSEAAKPLLAKNSRLIAFFKTWAEDHRVAFRQQLDSMVKANPHFPKKISVIYDDRKLRHTTHIVLEYLSEKQCILQIDNTVSFWGMALRQEEILQICSANNIDFSIAEERLSKKPNCIELREKQKKVDLEVRSISPLIEKVYGRMTTILQEKLGIPIQSTSLHFSPYNQKFTNECIPFAIQNKLDFTKNQAPSQHTGERVSEIAVRVRAEQAVMSYLFTGNKNIPHDDAASARDYGVTYSDATWYPNYPQVCNELDQRIGALPSQLLERLFLFIELGEEPSSLHPSFQAKLFKWLDAKSDPADYEPLCASSLSEENSIELQKMLAPSIIYRANTFFVKKAISAEFNKVAFIAIAHTKPDHS